MDVGHKVISITRNRSRTAATLCKLLEEEPDTLWKRAAQKVLKHPGRVFVGSYFPTEMQESYAQQAYIPATRTTWYALGWGYFKQALKVAGIYYSHKHEGLWALMAEWSLLAWFAGGATHDILKTVYTLRTGRPIGNVFLEFPYRSASGMRSNRAHYHSPPGPPTVA